MDPTDTQDPLIDPEVRAFVFSLVSAVRIAFKILE